MKRSGFTLVEILIVVIILGILAAIVVPQFTDASNEARMSSIQSDLQTVRSQIELYKAQHKDVDPWTNGGGTSAGFWTQMTEKTDADGNTGLATSVLGPYLGQIPANPWGPADNEDTVSVTDGDAGAAWYWDAATGRFEAIGTVDLNGDGDTLDDNEDLSQL
ncbi:MAG: prepilin-type N-terminal cleavage/methylation domain-containing protein [Planctomycetes bacterium]|nr:prepilin-type N-terminal cleavage/methylation domain-containing protein [Planctomycetota bacterium]